MATKDLTERIYCAIYDYWNRYGYSPSTREIADACDVVSTNTINYHLNKLEKMGALTRVEAQPRTIVLTGYSWSMDTSKIDGMCDYDGESL